MFDSLHIATEYVYYTNNRKQNIPAKNRLICIIHITSYIKDYREFLTTKKVIFASFHFVKHN